MKLFNNMTSEHQENLSKLSIDALEELCERQSKILKNKKLVDKLPDSGKLLQAKLEKVKHELTLRRDLNDIESIMKSLTINSKSIEALKGKHVQYICNIEKSPKKERYKPFSTLVHCKDSTKEKPTQLIPLAESITLLVEQATSLPIEQVKTKIEGTVHQAEEEQDPHQELES